MKNTNKSDIFNLESKSNLAKLLATENIEVQINNVDTASFDVQNRILTLPKFKIKSQDVLDMLVGHECSHALHTDLEGWKSIGDDDKLRMACNVIEDARIDKLIQKKYPGLTKNYINGFDMMMEKDFFGIRKMDIQELSLIDKINLYFKSSKRLSFSLDDIEKSYFEKVDNVSTIEDVIELAKEIIAYQEEQNQKTEIPNFDSVEDSDGGDNQEADGDEQESDDGETNENTESKNGSGSGDDLNNDSQDQTNKSNKSDENHDDEIADEPFSITQDNYEKNVKALSHDENSVGYEYLNLPKANLKNIVIDYKTHLSNFKKFEVDKDTQIMLPGYQAEFKSFKKDNMKTVNYLVKEFEMKKSAESYKRATTDKTGVLDPLKLKNYKFSDDIFKRLTVVPDAKNHGMIVLVDWSGSMGDIAYNVVEQLSNLAWFCQRINIPYEIYLFSNSTNDDRNHNHECFTHKDRDIVMSNFDLVNIASSKMKKSELDKSLMYLRMYCLLNDSYSYNSIDRKWFEYLSKDNSYSRWVDTYKMPRYMRMYSTPLNESLVACIDIIKKFKSDNKIEKMIFATITDGASNGNLNHWSPRYRDDEHGCKQLVALTESNMGIPIIKRKTKKYASKRRTYSSQYLSTSVLLDIIKDECGTNNIGFFLQNKATRSEAYHYVAKMKRKGNSSYYPEESEVATTLKQYRKDKCLISTKDGYDSYYLVLGNTKVVNNDLSEINEDATKAQIRNHFKKSMTSRLNSRVLLNNFIEKIA